MNTESFINDFQLKVTTKAQENKSKSEKITHWIHKHPTVMKTAEFIGGAFGIASIVSLPFSIPLIGTTAATLSAVGGGIMGLASAAAYKVLDIAVSPHHEMSRHMFKPASYGAGNLYYQGDVPVLELNYTNPKNAGLAHGYLMGEYLDILLNRLNLIKYIARIPETQSDPQIMAALRETIPADYLEEMQGVVEGYHQWALEKKAKIKPLTLDDLLLFHLMPDSIHFSPEGLEEEQNEEFEEVNESPSLACTVVIDRDAKEGMVFGRNMDWPSFGIFGSYSLIINRKHPQEKLSTVEVGLPGFVGTLTGMNNKGLSLAMNVCSGNTESVQGMPAAFFNRMCLEKCRNVNSVVAKVRQQAPLGSYHLSVADQASAKSLHLFQEKKNTLHVLREWEKGTPLITTNCKYTSNGRQIHHMHCSEERDLIINQLFKQAGKRLPKKQLNQEKLVTASLSLPYVNNNLTTHKVVMYPQSKKIKVAFDNAFGGDSPLHELDTNQLFE